MPCIQGLILCSRMALRCSTVSRSLITCNYSDSVIQANPKRTYCTSQAQNETQTRDVVGPAHPKSNLRLISFYQPADETPQEKLYREKREMVQEWNHKFWMRHNATFVQEKENYITEKLREKSKARDGNEALTSDEMSIFYKKFLNDNYDKHLTYNKEWYFKNIGLLWPGIKALMSRWRRNYLKQQLS